MQEEKERRIKISDYIRLYPRQKEVLPYIGKGYRIFYGGARGGGKSHLALAVPVLASLQYPGLRSLILRRHFSELEENFISKMLDLYPEGIFGYRYKSTKIAVFENGSRIIFRSAEREQDLQKVLGLEYHLIIIDEANQFTQKAIEDAIGSMRNANIKNFKPTLLMTGNPGGLSDMYFKTRFVHPQYQYWTTGELRTKDKYVFIPSTVYDNPSILENDPDYIENLKSMSEARRKAWLEGSWDVFEGQFFTEWNEKQHIVKPFKIPENWLKLGGLDIGGTKNHPTVMLKLAQDPKTMNIYVYDELTIVSSLEVCIEEIKEFQKRDPVDIIYADPDMWKTKIKQRESDVTPGIMFMNEGLPVVPADNIRVTGWYVVKSWMHWTSMRPPRLRIFSNCVETIRTLPMMVYNTRGNTSNEDMQDMKHDDYADALRYVIVSGFQYPTQGEIEEKMIEIRKEEISENIDNKTEKDYFYTTEYIAPPKGFEFMRVNQKSKTRNMLWV